MAKKENPAKETPQPETGKALVLTVKDRILMADFFPEKANLTDQWISKDISSKIEIGAEEKKTLGLKIVSGPGGMGRWVWDDKKEKVLRVVLSEVEAQFLKDQVERINRTAVAGEKGFTMDAAEVAKKIKEL